MLLWLFSECSVHSQSIDGSVSRCTGPEAASPCECCGTPVMQGSTALVQAACKSQIPAARMLLGQDGDNAQVILL